MNQPSKVQRITPSCQPVFPCWLWNPNVTPFSKQLIGWERWKVNNPGDYYFLKERTHFHPDQPSAPTEVPDALADADAQQYFEDNRTTSSLVASFQERAGEREDGTKDIIGAVEAAIDATNTPAYFDKLPKWKEARMELVSRLLTAISPFLIQPTQPASTDEAAAEGRITVTRQQLIDTVRIMSGEAVSLMKPTGQRTHVEVIEKLAADVFDGILSVPFAPSRPSTDEAIAGDHWAAGKALRRAFLFTISGLQVRIGRGDFGKGKTSREHICWMLNELQEKIDVFPADKTSRWLGFVQGVLAANGRIDVDEERDRTRPLFHEAYEVARALQRSKPPTSPEQEGQAVERLRDIATMPEYDQDDAHRLRDKAKSFLDRLDAARPSQQQGAGT